MSLKTRAFDIVLFGASGFTGERIALYLARVIHGLPSGADAPIAGAPPPATTVADAKTPTAAAVRSPAPATVGDAKSAARKRTFALAGRSAGKLTEVRQRLYKQLVADATAAGGPAFAVAEEDVCAVISGVDVSDRGALQAATQAGRVLINAVGPYRYYGEAVVTACIATATHYVDITGETEFMERMYLAHDDAARAAGVSLVMACGFDSLIADMGVVFTQRAFRAVYPRGVLCNVDSVLTVRSTDPKGSGVTGHATTLEALLESIANIAELRKNRKLLKAKQTGTYGDVGRAGAPSKPPRVPVQYDARVKRWTLPFMGSDASVVRNSQYSMFALDKANGEKDPRYPHYSAYFSLPSLFWTVFAVLMGVLLYAASRFRVTRGLMTRYPSLLTYGAFTHAGPTPVQLRHTELLMDFYGAGYSDDSQIPPADTKAAGAKKKGGAGKPPIAIHTSIAGPEPGYIACAIVCGQCAFTLLDALTTTAAAAHPTLIPAGVLTPAPAFRNTDLVERLHAEGVRFTVGQVTDKAPRPATPAAAK